VDCVEGCSGWGQVKGDAASAAMHLLAVPCRHSQHAAPHIAAAAVLRNSMLVRCVGLLVFACQLTAAQWNCLCGMWQGCETLAFCCVP
jgi:hypothetical protein